MERLAGQWVGPMPVDEFTSTFFPLSDDILSAKPGFSGCFFSQLLFEGNLCNQFIELVSSSNALPGFRLVNTSLDARRDAVTGMKDKPSVSGYRAAIKTRDRPTKYEDIELIIEIKLLRGQTDPFEDKTKEDAPTCEKRLTSPFEPTDDESEKYRGQLAYYAMMWCARQHRTHCFVVWIGDPHARIVRFDRSGGIVSAKFDYRTYGDLLLNFLWRYSMSSDQARGMDPTVTTASPEETKAAQVKLLEWKPTSDRSVLKLQLPDPIKGHETRTRSVLVWGPLADPQSVTGRATRGYPAWDPKGNEGKGCVIFVKDFWRSCEDGMEKETDILKELNAANCRNVPKLICGDDLPGQFTITKQYANKSWNIGTQEDRFVKRIHTRFAEDTVGKHLTPFESSREFLQAIYDAFLAHYDAYRFCGILHRDISAGNILMKKDGGGFLNDWDLAKHIYVDRLARQPFRSGTWQFMAADLLMDPKKLNSLQDDIESFFWVIVYHMLRYMKHNASGDLEQTMNNIFDSQIGTPYGQEACGGLFKYSLLTHGITLGSDFSLVNNELLSAFFNSTFHHWKRWYTYPFTHQNKVEDLAIEKKISFEVAAEQFPFDTKHLGMDNHNTMIQMFEEVLSQEVQWPKNDCSNDHLPDRTKPLRTEDVEESSSEQDSLNGAEGDTSSSLPMDPDKDYKNQSGENLPLKL